MNQKNNKQLEFAKISLSLFIVFGLALAPAALAQNEDELAEETMSAEELAYIEQAQKIWDQLDKRTGTIELPGGFATMEVSDEYYYLDTNDAATVLEEVWGNPPGDETLGMIMSADQTPFDEDSWAVTFEYIEDGYVSDKNAVEIDYKELLSQMKEDTERGNKERVKAGYDSVKLVGWAESPFYSTTNKHLYWAKELLFSDQSSVLNYDIRALGRRGVLSMTFVADTDQLNEVNAAREDILQMISFNEGFRYQDYEPGNDKLAAYGVGALVAGAVAKKTGLLVAALVLLKKFWFLIAVGAALIFARLKLVFDKN